jgi:hypothetical protein|tara:strand:- start:48 stop:269 length:222 start_codon:yes stop_codon:yes gene_type:complete
MTDITATIQDGSTIRVLERTVGAVNRLRTLHDVDTTTLNDGAMLIYDQPSDSFKTTTSIESNTGTIIFNGGNF